MIKAALFDIDGVVLKPRTEYFSEKLAREKGIPLEKTLPFFKRPYQLCIIDKANLREELEKVLPSWGWEGSIGEFMDYWFEGEKEVNQDVLDEVKELREKGIKCSLASDIESLRAGYLLDEAELNEQFDGSFFSCDLRCTKDEPAFFEKVVKELGKEAIKPGDVVFWDDDEKNVEAARRVGIKAELFKDVESYKERMAVLLEGNSRSPEVE